MLCETWVSLEDLESCVDENVDTDGLDFEGVAEYVSQVMYSLTGRQFGGLCGPLTVYPFDETGCGCVRQGKCCCRVLLKIPGPIFDVDMVVVDGVGLVEGDDWIKAGSQALRRVGGSWPCLKEYRDPSPDFYVTYTRGRPIPVAGRVAARELGCQIVKTVLGLPCDLATQGLVGVTREGVQLQFDDPEELVDKGLTGIRSVDLWIASVNPFRRKRRAQMYRGDDTRRVSRVV